MRRWLWRLQGFFLWAPAARALALACFLVFLVQQVVSQVEFAYGYSYGQVLVSCFGLNWPLLSHGFFWQPVTYLFLHASWLHLGFNMLTVLLFGSGVEMEVGSRRFWRIFLGGGVLAGLGWFAVAYALSFLPPFENLTHWMPLAVRNGLGAGVSAGKPWDAGLLIGASGGVFALIGTYAALFPNRMVYVLLVFVPVKLKARTLALLLVGLDVAAAVFVQSQVADAAHLSGCLAGYLYGKRLRRLGVAGEE